MEPVKYRYSVVTFLDLPFIDHARYICVPNSWVRSRRRVDKKVVVAYPIENPSETRERARKRQKFSPEWKHYIALLRYETDYFDDAEIYINLMNKSAPVAMSNKGTVSTSDIKTRGSKRREASNTQGKPQVSVVPFKGTAQPVVAIRRLSLPINEKNIYKIPPVKTATETNHPCKENQQQSHLEQLLTQQISTEKRIHSLNNTGNQATPVNPAQLNFMVEFISLMNKLNGLCGETRAIFTDISGTFTASQETLKNISASIEEYHGSNKNTTGPLPEAIQKISSTNENVEVNKTIFNVEDLEDDDDEDYDINNDVDDESDDDFVDDDQDYTKNNGPKHTKQPNNRRQTSSANIRTFVLPPEYDPNDTKWTLKHRSYKPGLVELMPQSGVYVRATELAHIKRLSNDCKTLARKLLTEIFSRNALSVCSLTGARAQAFFNCEVRPGLDENARMVLFTFVEEYGLEHGWSMNEGQGIVNTVRSKIQDIRAKFGCRK